MKPVTRCEYQGGIEAYRGAQLEIVRRTPSGTMVCKVLASIGAWKEGDTVHLQLYELGNLRTVTKEGDK